MSTRSPRQPKPRATPIRRPSSPWAWLREPWTFVPARLNLKAALRAFDPDPRDAYRRRRGRDAVEDCFIGWRLAFHDRYVEWSDSMLTSGEVSPPSEWLVFSFVIFDLVDKHGGYTRLSLRPMDPFVAREFFRGSPYRAACIQAARAVRTGGWSADLPTLLRPVRQALAEITPETEPERLSDAAILGAAMVVADVASTYRGRDLPPNRPRDDWWRLFHYGVAYTYAVHGVGPPKPADLTDLSLTCGLESGRRENLRKRWKDRLRALKGRETPAPSQFFAP